AAVALTWLIGRRLFGSALAATCAALLLACSPLAVYYGQEVRMYSQVIALGLLAALAYLYRRFVWYAPCAAAAIYSHYLGLTLVAALNLHALISPRALDRRRWLGWLAANLAVALVFLPWLPTFVDQLRGRSFNTAPRTTEGLALDTLSA